MHPCYCAIFLCTRQQKPSIFYFRTRKKKRFQLGTRLRLLFGYINWVYVVVAVVAKYGKVCTLMNTKKNVYLNSMKHAACSITQAFILCDLFYMLPHATLKRFKSMSLCTYSTHSHSYNHSHTQSNTETP